MKADEMSNALDVLCNSYNLQANFGEGASSQPGSGITLDEYEKSLLLTQAQDIIIKSYFDKSLNNQAQGFDDSTRRQVDFSSLITNKRYSSFKHDDTCYDDRGIKVTLDKDVLFILNEKLEVKEGKSKKTYVVVPINYKEYDREMSKAYAQPLKKQAWRLFSNNSTEYDIDSEIIPIYNTISDYPYSVSYVKVARKGESTKDDDFVIDTNYNPTKEEESAVSITTSTQSMAEIIGGLLLNASKTSTDAFTQIIKVQNSNCSLDTSIEYIVRYVKRPTPIICSTLPNELAIEGTSKQTDCCLNPILHMDIVNKAFELALTTRGGGTTPSTRNTERQ